MVGTFRTGKSVEGGRVGIYCQILLMLWTGWLHQFHSL